MHPICPNCESEDTTQIIEVRSYLSSDDEDGEAVEITTAFDGWMCRDCLKEF